MSMGHVQQIGTPLELYDQPNNTFVAGFIGLPPMNFYPDMLFEDGKLKGNGFEVELTDEEKDTLKHYYGKEIILGVRPENITADGDLQVSVTNNENLGMNTLVHGLIGSNAHIVAKLRGWAEYRNGDTAGMKFGRKHFFDKDTTNAIRKEGK